MLINKLLFSNTAPKIMRKSLDLLSTRQNQISSNIGNLDTPGYKASEIDFQGQLREALGSKGQINLQATNEKHFGPRKYCHFKNFFHSKKIKNWDKVQRAGCTQVGPGGHCT